MKTRGHKEDEKKKRKGNEKSEDVEGIINKRRQKRKTKGRNARKK